MAGPSSMKTPPLRVSRPVAACSRCRSLKIGCDGKLPACTPCAKHGKGDSCSGASDEFAKGKDRSYVAFLESRREKLEKSIRQLNESRAPRPAQQPAPMSGRSLDIASESGVRTKAQSKAAKQQEASDMDSLVSDFGSLAVNATARDFQSFSSSMSFSRLTLTACTRRSLPYVAANLLPPRHETSLLIQMYIENIFVLLPFHSESSLFRSRDALYENEGQAATDWDYWSVNMALALASACQSRLSMDSSHANAVRFAAVALTRADSVLHPGSIMGLQAVLFLTEFGMLLPGYFDSWQLIGVAARIVIDLGLHQDPPKASSSSLKQLNLRQRVFYCVYSLERSLSMTLDLPFTFSDESINVTLPPIPDDSPTSPASPGVLGLQSLDSALHLFHLRKIQSGWYQELHSGRLAKMDPISRSWLVCQKTQQWAESISEYTPLEIKNLLEVQQLHSAIFVLSRSRGLARLTDAATSYLFDCCVAYAEKMSFATQNTSNAVFYTFYDSMRVDFVGNSFLDLIWDPQEQSPLSKRLLGSISSQDALKPSQRPDGTRTLHEVKIAAAINFIDQISAILVHHSHRWEESLDLYQNFEKASASTRTTLEFRREQLRSLSSTTAPDLINTANPGPYALRGTLQHFPQADWRSSDLR